MVLGMFRSYRESRNLKFAEKCGNVLKNKVTTKEQRLEAIDALFTEDKAEVAIPQLLKRFHIVVDSGIQDKREKEMCAERITSFESEAMPFIEKALRTSDRVSWVMQMAEKLMSPEDYRNLLLNVLGSEIAAFDDGAKQKQVEIILALKDIPNDEVVLAVAEFLNDRDESLRMAALQCLEVQAQSVEKAKEIIVELLNHETTDDNSRFLGNVRTMVEKTNGPLPNEES